MTAIPVLTTERLRLRAPQLADFAAYAAFYASARSVHEDGPYGEILAWKGFAANTGLWALRGYGAWSVEDRATGAYLGEVGFFHPANYPEAEIGWMLVDGAEGKGVAFEAARVARDWGFATAGFATLVSYIAPANARSIRLAERLGARHDAAAPVPAGEGPCLVYRHDPARGAA